jgi:hypothetical protein
VKLEKWLIFISSSKQLPQDRRMRASQDRAMLLLESAMFTSDFSMDVKKKSILLQEAQKEFDAAGKYFFSSQAKDYMKFITTQAESGIPPGKSVMQNVLDCVARGRDDLAERFRKQFSLKPHLFWKAKIRGMGKRNLWLEAARLVTLEKEAGRWVKVEEVLEMCFEQGADTSAAKIAFELLDDTNPEKARAFVRLRMWPEALKFSAKSRCLDATEDIVFKCRDAEVLTKARELLNDIRKNPSTQDGSNGDGGLFGFVTGAVRVEPQRCQQQ